MEGETMLMALAGSVVAAYLVTRFGSRRSARHLRTPDPDPTEDKQPSRRRRLRRNPPSDPDTTPDAAAHNVTPVKRRSPAARASAHASVDAELLRTLEELAAHPQNRAAAVNLLRQRTGMSASQARRYINAL